MALATVVFTFRWESEQTDCRECSTCKDMIVSDMWRLVIITKGEPKIIASQSNDSMAINVSIEIPRTKRQTDVVICSSCHEMIEIK